MTTFSLLLCIPLALSCAIGYRSTCNSTLQGALLPHRIAYRSAQLFGALLVFIVAWFHSPTILIMCVPVAVILLYAGAVFSLAMLSHRLNEEDPCTEQHEFAEAFVSTGISVTFLMGTVLLIAAALSYLPGLQNGHYVSIMDQLLCHGLLLGVNAALLCLLLHQMFFFLKHPAESANASQAMLEFQERIKNPPTMR